MALAPRSHRQRSVVKSLAILAAAASVSIAHAGNPDERDAEALRAFAERYAAAWSSGDPEYFGTFYAEDGMLQINEGEPSVGRAAVVATARDFMTAFPDMVVRLEKLRRTGEQVEFHWHWTGTNTGPGGTGSAVDLRGVEIWTFDEEGLVVESLGYYDEAEYARQLQAGAENTD